MAIKFGALLISHFNFVGWKNKGEKAVGGRRQEAGGSRHEAVGMGQEQEAVGMRQEQGQEAVGRRQEAGGSRQAGATQERSDEEVRTGGFEKEGGKEVCQMRIWYYKYYASI